MRTCELLILHEKLNKINSLNLRFEIQSQPETSESKVEITSTCGCLRRLTNTAVYGSNLASDKIYFLHDKYCGIFVIALRCIILTMWNWTTNRVYFKVLENTVLSDE